MNVSKSHATSYGNNPVSLVEGAATNLTAVIVDLVELLQMRDNGQSGSGLRNDERPESGIQETYSLDGLKMFLETRTDEIVQAIQALLQSMRQSTSFGSEFTETIASITEIVDMVLSTSGATVSKPFCAGFRGRAEGILDELAGANEALVGLGKTLVEMPGSKSLKQKVASSSYEIAKFVKV
jgi:hypothetical protein